MSWLKSWSMPLGAGEDLAEAAGDDLVLAGLHHPDADDELAAGAGVDLNAGLAVAELLGHLRRTELALVVVPDQMQVRHRVGDGGDIDLGADVLEFGESLDDALAAGLPFLPDGGVIAV